VLLNFTFLHHSHRSQMPSFYTSYTQILFLYRYTHAVFSLLYAILLHFDISYSHHHHPPNQATTLFIFAFFLILLRLLSCSFMIISLSLSFQFSRGVWCFVFFLYAAPGGLENEFAPKSCLCLPSLVSFGLLAIIERHLFPPSSSH